MNLSWEQVRSWRLGRQHLAERAPREQALAVVSDLCGLHAQLLSSAELTLWARVEDLEPEAVRTMLWEQRTLVKQWAMRGTLHLLPSAELGLWHGALGTYDHYRRPSSGRAFGVRADDVDPLLEAIGTVLADRMLTRAELGAAVAQRLARPQLADLLAGSWGSLLKPAAFTGRLCFAPDEGRSVRFTHPATWVGEHEPLDGAAALAEVARRFLATFGPATREDLRRWWATTPAKAGRLLAGLDDAVEVDVQGAPMWMLREDAAAAARAPARTLVRLLPGFDQYVIGSTSHVEALLPGPFRDRVHRPQGWVSPVLLVDGGIAGVWRHERRGRRLAVTIEPFAKRVPRRVRAGVEEEVVRLSSFLAAQAQLRWDL